MRGSGILSVLALSACATASAQVTPLPMALCAGWQGERVCELLHEDATIRVLRCTFAPGVGHERHYHPPHYGYVLSGQTTMRITTDAGVVDRPVRAGGGFSSDAELIHEALNVGDETATYLIVEKKNEDRRSASEISAGLCAS
ncbi:MAG: cupin domain-containing protein [Hyphomonadaceae bacterium]